MDRLLPISENSDRIALTCRMTADNHREWLDSTGTVALVYHERGYWYARKNEFGRRACYETEMGALSHLLDEPLCELRDSRRDDLPGSVLRA